MVHVNDALKIFNGESYEDNEEDEVSSKIQQIRDIRNAILEVIHVIQRYGLKEKVTFGYLFSYWSYCII